VTETEKRRYARTTVDMEVTLSVDSDRVKARSKDISLGGMFVKTDRPPPLESTIGIEMTLPEQKDILVVSCIVRWVATEGVGVQFTALDPQLTRAISHYVATRPTPRPGKLRQQR
jgi:uncharacterized protein (TIGR02266 family)